MQHRSVVSKYRGFLAASIATLFVSNSVPLVAATLTWDTSPLSAGIQEGSGIWDLANANWLNAGSNVVWTNDPANDAVFGIGTGAAGTVTLGTDITANSLTFNTTGYTIASGNLTLIGPSSITTATGVTATITSSLIGGNGLTKTGAGTLLLNGNNSTLAGPITVNGGTLAVDGSQTPNRLPANAGITVNSGGAFEIRGVNALPNHANSPDITIAAGGVFRVVTGGSAAAGAGGQSHAHVRNLTLNGGAVELGYSGGGSAYSSESFQLNGDITVGGSAPSTVSVINGATTDQQGIAFNGTRSITVADVTGSVAGDFIVAAELENSDGNNGGFNKLGVGTIVLAANNSYTAGTTITAGTVQVGNGGSTGSLGTGAVTNNATLAFNFGSSGAITNNISGSGTVQQIGTGTTLYTGAAAHTGATQVNAGKLFINGSLAATSATTVAAGATLGGSGTVSGLVTVNHNGLIESGNGSGTGTLTIGSLTLGNAPGNLMAFNLTPTASGPEIVVSTPNGLVANGGTQSAAINILSLPSGLGVYTLIDYDGTLGGGFGAFKLGTLPPRIIASLVDNSGATSIDLNVTGTDFPIWSGALSGTWTTATLASPKNWVLNSSPGTATDFIAADNVLFDDSASGTTTVDISGANVSPDSILFNNTGKAYTIGGTHGIAGATGLTKTGSGTLVIGTTNSFTGAVTLSAGTVSIPGLANAGTASALGAGSTLTLADASTPMTLQLTGATSTTNRTITVNTGGVTIDVSQAANTHTLGGIVSGNGGFTKTGPGTLVFNALNTYSGNTVVDGGTLQLNASNSGAGVGGIIGTLTINSGGTVKTTAANAFGWNGAQQVFTLNINGGLLDNTAAGDQGWALSINLTGGVMQSNGGVSSSTTNQLFTLGGGSSVHTLPSATTSVIAGRVTIREGNGGDLLPFNVEDGAAATDLLVSASLVTGAARGISKDGVGTMVLSGDNTYAGATLINAGTLQVGNGGASGTLGSGAGLVTNNAQLVFNHGGIKTMGNAITGTGTVQKIGTGSVILSGALDYSGATQINAGKLFINGSLANSAVSVGAGGTLGGGGTVSTSVTVGPNGAIESGNGSGSGAGTLTLNTLTLGGTAGDLSSFTLFVATGVPSVVVSAVDGLFANGGTQSATINVGGSVPALGTYTLINYEGALGGGFGAFKLGTLPPRILGNLVDNAGSTSIDLNVTGIDFPVWSGALSGEWSTATLANPKNWKLNSNASTATDYISGDNVRFDDTATGTTDLVINSNVTPTSMIFDHSARAYSVTGTAGIAGTIGLVKNGSGTLTISNTNTFTGNVTIGSGVISVNAVTNSGVASPLGAGTSVTLGDAGTSGTLRFTGTTGTTNRPLIFNGNGGGLDVAAGGTLTQSAAMSGTGGLVKSGPGTLVLTTNASTFTGNFAINGGTVTVPVQTASAATANSLGLKDSTRAITINNGGTLNFTINNVFGGAGMTSTQIPKIVIAEGGKLDTNQFNTIGNLELSGGTLTQAATGTGYQGYQFIGEINVTGTVPSLITTTTDRGNHLLGDFGTTFNVGDVTNNSAADLIVAAPILNASPDYGTTAASLVKSGPGTMVLTAANTYSGSTNINAGTLQIGDGGAIGTINNNTVFNEGTLAFKLSVNRTFGNLITGSGGLQQSGTGSLFLTAANTYAGPTVISAGKLFINGGPLLSSGVAVGAGGTLGGNNFILNGVVIQNNGTIEPGNGSGVGTLTVGALTLGVTGGDHATINLVGSAASAPLVVSGADGLVANGGPNSTTINVIGGTPVIGSYALIDYVGVLGGGIGSFTLGSLPPRVIGNLSNNTTNTTIDLNVTGTDSPVWTGSLSGVWSTATLADPKNWVLESNANAKTDFIAGDRAVFNDNAAGTTNVDVSGNNVSPSLALFENSTLNYTLSGTHGIAGTGGLTKSGTGTLTINNVNSYSGSTRINSGKISVASLANVGTPSPLGTGSLILGSAGTSGTLQYTGLTATTNRPITLEGSGGALEVTQAGTTFTQTGIMSGAGGFTKTGSGTMVIATNQNSFTGDVSINGGVLTIPNGTGSGDATSALGAKNSARSIIVNNNATLRFTINNVFGGGGMSQPQIPNIVINQGGTLDATRFNTVGNIILNGGTLTHASTDPAPTYEGYQFIGGITVGGTVPSSIATTNGKANHLLGGGSNTFDVANVTGNAGADLIVSAPISDGSGDYEGTGSVIKTGTGTMQISSVSTYTGTTNVNAGTLTVTGSISGSAVTVGLEAVLDGNGATGAVTLLDGARLVPGVGVGTLTVGGLSMTLASRLDFELGAPGIIGGSENDLLVINGDLLIDGLLHIIPDTDFAHGTYRLANFTGQLTDSFLELEESFLAMYEGSHIDTSIAGQLNLVVIPEPATTAILLGGLAAFASTRRRSRPSHTSSQK